MTITVNLAPTCRNGHVKTSANTYRSKSSGHERCRDCRRKHKPLKTRPCAQCRELFSGQGKRCPACLALHHTTTVEAMAPVRTRTCGECHEVRPLDDFRLTVADFRAKGLARYSDRCQDCREDEEFAASPYERAKQQIVRIFGVPAKEWMNRPGHVLADLHFLRMLAIQHAEAKLTGAKPVRAELDTRSHLLFDRLREFLHQPGAVATTYTLRAA